MARVLITSALPYINGVKHLGNLAGSMLPADVYARFRRLQGDEVLFICATDEHGTPAELAAAEAGQDVRAYCDEQHLIQKAAGEGFSLSYDWFGRSSNPPNHALTQHFAWKLEQAGLIEERISEQVYSVADGRFLPDRYVEGTCPHCGFERARGDQCDQCGRLLDPKDLKNPVSKISGSSELEVRQTKHLFLKQSQMPERLRAWMKEIGAGTKWPKLANSIAEKWLDEGLQDRAITRDLSWGVKVLTEGPGSPVRPGFEDKVFYVWFDAPIEYIGATVEWTQETGAGEDAWRRWWRTDQGAHDVEYIQFMGKDNVAFHTVSFPITLIGSGEPWKTVDRLKAFNWVTWYGGKFSTSEKRGVFMDQALELLPADYWRWHLMANAPETADAEFTWESFQAGVNADLADKFGNFVNRVMKFCASRFDGVIPDGGEPGALEDRTAERLCGALRRVSGALADMQFRPACDGVREVWMIANEYITEAAPWTHFKTDQDKAALGVRTGLNLAAISAVAAQPLIPGTAAKVLNALGIPDQSRSWRFGDLSDPATGRRLLDALPRGAAIEVPDVLFAKISDEQIAEWAERFGGAA